jgi:hypothetical protein
MSNLAAGSYEGPNMWGMDLAAPTIFTPEEIQQMEANRELWLTSISQRTAFDPLKRYQQSTLGAPLSFERTQPTKPIAPQYEKETLSEEDFVLLTESDRYLLKEIRATQRFMGGDLQNGASGYYRAARVAFQKKINEHPSLGFFYCRTVFAKTALTL